MFYFDLVKILVGSRTSAQNLPVALLPNRNQSLNCVACSFPNFTPSHSVTLASPIPEYGSHTPTSGPLPLVIPLLGHRYRRWPHDSPSPLGLYLNVTFAVTFPLVTLYKISLSLPNVHIHFFLTKYFYCDKIYVPKYVSF